MTMISTMSIKLITPTIQIVALPFNESRRFESHEDVLPISTETVLLSTLSPAFVSIVNVCVPVASLLTANVNVTVLLSPGSKLKTESDESISVAHEL